MPTCREITETLTDHLEGELPWRRSAAMGFHLLRCRACRTYRQQLVATRVALRQLPARGPRPQPSTDLMAAFARAHPPRPRARRPVLVFLARLDGWTRGARGYLLVAVTMLVLLAGALMGDRVAGPVGTSVTCLLLRLGAGSVALGAVAVAVRAHRVRLSAGTLAVVATTAASAAHVGIRLECGLSYGLSHTLVHHLGGVLGAAFLGVALAWLLARRPSAQLG